ncbi:tat pathway signal sequence [Segniliparus rotundus]|nr:tat pathway signal sequence [Segniliparus rotundus]
MRIAFSRLGLFRPVAVASAFLLAGSAMLVLEPAAQARPNWCQMNRGVTGTVQRDLDHLRAAMSKPGWRWDDPAVRDAVAWVGTDLSTTITRLDRVTGGAAQGNIWVNDPNPWDDDYSEYADLLRELDGSLDDEADPSTVLADIAAVESKTRELGANCDGVPVPPDAGPIHPNPPNN